jgi:hypothetical protein
MVRDFLSVNVSGVVFVKREGGATRQAGILSFCLNAGGCMTMLQTLWRTMEASRNIYICAAKDHVVFTQAAKCFIMSCECHADQGMSLCPPVDIQMGMNPYFYTSCGGEGGCYATDVRRSPYL